MTGGLWVDLVSHGSDLLLAMVTEAFRGDRQAQVTIYRSVRAWTWVENVVAIMTCRDQVHHSCKGE